MRFFTLLNPRDGKRYHRLRERGASTHAAIEYRLHRRRSQQRQPQHPADVGRINLLGPGDLLNGRVPAGLQQLLPSERPGDGLHERAIDVGRGNPLPVIVTDAAMSESISLPANE